MLRPDSFYEQLKGNDLTYFTGVPDSTLKHFSAYLVDTQPTASHLVCANEGGAISVAVGHHLATGRIPVVYMQNSGLGNSVNPVTSIVDPDVYSIPMLLIIGWRGKPGLKDEPQHRKQGRITPDMLDTLEIPWVELSGDEKQAADALREAALYMREKQAPYALLVPKGTFEAYPFEVDNADDPYMSREEAICKIAEHAGEESIIVSTTGMASRELFEHRKFQNQKHHQDFLTVGGMGHASQIALGIALAKPQRTLYCLDGDGAAIMHMGGLGLIASEAPQNFIHVIFNNGVHDSVGGQPTISRVINLASIGGACGYKEVKRIYSQDELQEALESIQEKVGPVLLEVFVRPGNRSDIGRPTKTPLENKQAFMKALS